MDSFVHNFIRSFQKDILNCFGPTFTSKRKMDVQIAYSVIPSNLFQYSTLYLKMGLQQPQISPKQLCAG